MRTAQPALSVAKGERHEWRESSNRRHGIFCLSQTFQESIRNQPLATLADSRCVTSLISQCWFSATFWKQASS